jgi:hypothetical protein
LLISDIDRELQSVKDSHMSSITCSFVISAVA